MVVNLGGGVLFSENPKMRGTQHAVTTLDPDPPCLWPSKGGFFKMALDIMFSTAVEVRLGIVVGPSVRPLGHHFFWRTALRIFMKLGNYSGIDIRR